jgi:hypothetical protein
MDSHERMLAAFLAGELDERAAAEFDAHLLDCADCWRAVGEDRAGQAAAARLGEPAPHALADRVRMAVELTGARPDRRQRHDQRQRHPRRVELLGAGALAVAAAVATLIMVFGSSQPADPPSISGVVEAAQRMPSPTSAPSPGPVAQGAPWTMRAGMAHLRLQYYLLDGVELLVARSDRPFDTPEGARPTPPGGMPWTIDRNGITVYCPHDDVLIAAAVPADRLVALAQRLPNELTGYERNHRLEPGVFITDTTRGPDAPGARQHVPRTRGADHAHHRSPDQDQRPRRQRSHRRRHRWHRVRHPHGQACCPCSGCSSAWTTPPSGSPYT